MSTVVADLFIFNTLHGFVFQGEREDILRVLSQQVKLASDVNLTEIAEATENFTGADLRGLLCSAQMLTEDTNEVFFLYIKK